MTRAAIVYHQRHHPTERYARWLADMIHIAGDTAELVPVKEASAHEVVLYDALVLVSPVTFGRMHGASLARAVASIRPTAVVGVGDPAHMANLEQLFHVGPDKEPSRFLEDYWHPAGRPPLPGAGPVFFRLNESGHPSEAAAVLDWVRGLGRQRFRSTLDPGPE